MQFNVFDVIVVLLALTLMLFTVRHYMGIGATNSEVAKIPVTVDVDVSDTPDYVLDAVHVGMGDGEVNVTAVSNHTVTLRIAAERRRGIPYLNDYLVIGNEITFRFDRVEITGRVQDVR
jgi:hypothetical protein